MAASMLRELFPDGRFAPPATEAEIAAAEAMLGARFPEQLRRLYFECDGFRESRGNAKYLLSLANADFIGSLVSVTQNFWQEFRPPVFPDLRRFVLFGSSSAGEIWGINLDQPSQIVAYHHHMENSYEIVGADILDVYRTDYARYDEM